MVESRRERLAAVDPEGCKIPASQPCVAENVTVPVCTRCRGRLVVAMNFPTRESKFELSGTLPNSHTWAAERQELRPGTPLRLPPPTLPSALHVQSCLVHINVSYLVYSLLSDCKWLREMRRRCRLSTAESDSSRQGYLKSSQCTSSWQNQSRVSWHVGCNAGKFATVSLAIAL